MIDFGEGVTDLVGNTRAGSIEIQLTAPYRDSGTVITTTPDNYTLNNYLIEGGKSVTNMGENDNGNLNFDISIVDGKVTDPDGEFATWDSERNRDWIAGEETTILTDGLSGILDDEYSLTGTASGVNRYGIAYTVEIIDPLLFSIDCRWIKQGAIEIYPQDLAVRTIDYGDGECDSEATISVGNFTLTFHMW